MKITFNQLGVVVSTDTTDESLRQGNAGVNHLKAYFQGKNNVNYTALFAFTRSNGSYISDIAMTPDPTDLTLFTYQFDDEWFFALSGETTCTVKLVNSSGTVACTGQITFNIEKTDFSHDDPQITVTQMNELIERISAKLNIQNGIVSIARTQDVVVSEYADGQIFYITTEKNFYKLSDSSLVLWDKVAVFVNPILVTGSTLPVDRINCPTCYLIYSNVVYQKDRIEGNNIVFVSQYHIMSGTNQQSDTFGRVEYRINKNTGEFVSQTIDTRKIYNKNQIDEQFYNKEQADSKYVDLTSEQEISGRKVSTTPPQLKEGTDISNGRDLAYKDYVDTEVGNVDSDLTSHKNNTSNPHQVTKGQIGLGNVDNVKQVPYSEKGASNGVATLDSNKKVPVSQLPDAVLGQVEYCGNFNASSNQDQTIRTPRKGDYYICNDSGIYNPDGTNTGIDYELGDWAIYDTKWEKIDNTDAVQSVNGKTGAVVLDKTDIGLGNVDDVKQYPNTSGVNLENTKLDTNSAIANFQPKTKYADLSSIPANAWVEDTTTTPHTWKYTSGNIFSSVGFIENNDVAFATGIDEITTLLLGTYRLLKVEVESTDESTTYATVTLLQQPEDTLNIQVGVIKQFTGGDYLGAVLNITTMTYEEMTTLSLWDIYTNKLGNKTYGIIKSLGGGKTYQFTLLTLVHDTVGFVEVMYGKVRYHVGGYAGVDLTTLTLNDLVTNNAYREIMSTTKLYRHIIALSNYPTIKQWTFDSTGTCTYGTWTPSSVARSIVIFTTSASAITKISELESVALGSLVGKGYATFYTGVQYGITDIRNSANGLVFVLNRVDYDNYFVQATFEANDNDTCTDTITEL